MEMKSILSDYTDAEILEKRLVKADFEGADAAIATDKHDEEGILKNCV